MIYECDNLRFIAQRYRNQDLWYINVQRISDEEWIGASDWVETAELTPPDLALAAQWWMAANPGQNIDPYPELQHDWPEDYIPTSMEIAETVLKRLRAKGWEKTWSHYDGLKICHRVSVWLSGYMDHDYEESFLFKVWTNHSDSDQTIQVTVTDMLAVYTSGSSVTDVAWYNDPHLFFDVDGPWEKAALHWWVSWTYTGHGFTKDEADDTCSPAVINHNNEIRSRDQANARSLNLELPYLQERLEKDCE